MNCDASTGKTLGLYLSVPFCKAKCSFCNFASDVFGAERLQAYVNTLCRELSEARSVAEARGAHLPSVVDSVYFGGGTPSLLEPHHLEQIFGALRDEFSVNHNAEITLEAAPNQLETSTLESALKLGVNRVSFGVQSFIDRESAAVGRLHQGAECHAEIARMRIAGVERVSLDLIAGLPYQTSESWAESLDQAIATGTDHISIYMLEIDEDSRLGREALAGGRRYHAGALPDEDATADWYQSACTTLAGAGLHQYEISNFARSGFQSRHNLKYWHRQPYLGVGLDAHSMLWCEGGGGVRWANPGEMDTYLPSNESASPLQILSPTKDDIEIDQLGPDEAFEESLFLGLRLNEGINLESLRQQFGAARLEPAMASLSEIEAAGLIARSSQTIQLTASGRLASNEVFSRLLVA